MSRIFQYFQRGIFDVVKIYELMNKQFLTKKKRMQPAGFELQTHGKRFKRSIRTPYSTLVLPKLYVLMTLD